MTQFRLQAGDNHVLLRGTDDSDNPFELTLDRVWAMNLQMELNDFLAGGFTKKELRRVDL